MNVHLLLLLVPAVTYAVQSTTLAPPQCPSKEELTALSKSIDGELIQAGEKGYDEAKVLKNTLYNSQFSFILYATSQSKKKLPTVI